MSYDIDNFSKLFVEKRWRDRFIHEFNKKPHDLMHRCIREWVNIFKKNVLGTTIPKDVNNEIIKIINWGNIIEEIEWNKFIDEYPKSHAGFIAISQSGNLGFLETHEAHPKESKHYYLYKA